VDDSRVKDVGPERAAAEWLLRCGAGVRWKDSESSFVKDYNSLPPGNYRNLFIEEIDATDSCIMSVGFPYLSNNFNGFLIFTSNFIYCFCTDGLKYVKKVTLHKCSYLDDEALPMLSAIKDSLEELQLSSCGDISDSGVKSLAKLTKLRHLLLYDLPEVKNKEGCIHVLETAVPGCKIDFPYAQASEHKNAKGEAT